VLFNSLLCHEKKFYNRTFLRLNFAPNSGFQTHSFVIASNLNKNVSSNKNYYRSTIRFLSYIIAGLWERYEQSSKNISINCHYGIKISESVFEKIIRIRAKLKPINYA